jgi:hypothetical protein
MTTDPMPTIHSILQTGNDFHKLAHLELNDPEHPDYLGDLDDRLDGRRGK